MDKNEQKMRQIAKEVFDQELAKTQYGFSSIPFHTHNQTDSPKIPPTSVNNFASLPATPGGVLSPDNISVSQPPFGIIYPNPVIRGVGVGSFSAFNGGSAPLGSMVVFLPPDSTVDAPNLWIMLENSLSEPTWYGVNLTAL